MLVTPIDETRTAQDIAVSAIEDILQTTALGPAFSPSVVAHRIPEDLRAMHYGVVFVQLGCLEAISLALEVLRKEADSTACPAALLEGLADLAKQIRSLTGDPRNLCDD